MQLNLNLIFEGLFSSILKREFEESGVRRFGFVTCLLGFCLASPAFGALSVRSERGLDFASGFGGDEARVIAADSSAAAQFRIFGEPHAVVQIFVPYYPVNLCSASGSASCLEAHSFYSSKAEVVLDSMGQGEFTMGATLEAIPHGISAGNYSAFDGAVQISSGLEVATGMFEASVRVKTSLSVVRAHDLNFGQMPSGSSEGTVVGASSLAARFSVVGEPNTQVTIQVPFSMNLFSPNSAQWIYVDRFFSYPNFLVLDSKGRGEFSVGATHHAISCGLPIGDYVGTEDVFVSYYAKGGESKGGAATALFSGFLRVLAQ